MPDSQFALNPPPGADPLPAEPQATGALTYDVVIACYNAQATLAETLDSILEQTVLPERVLVVDDCSTDDSVAVARAYAERSAGRIRVLTLKENVGPGLARNAGIKTARSGAIAFIDADDKWTPMHAASLLSALVATPSAMVAFSRVAYFGDRSEESPSLLEPGTPLCLFPSILEQNFLPLSATMVRREALMRTGGFLPLRRCEDFELWVRLSRLYAFVFVDEASVWYRVHALQTTAAGERMARAAWEVRASVLGYIRQLGAADVLAEVERAITRAFYHDVGEAWMAADLSRLDATLAASRGIRVLAKANRKAWWRSAVGRPILSILRVLRDTVPEGQAVRLRTLAKRLRASFLPAPTSDEP
jgi:hypothetical protein